GAGPRACFRAAPRSRARARRCGRRGRGTRAPRRDSFTGPARAVATVAAMTRRALSAMALAVVPALAAAGCGGGANPYTAKGTAPCLRTKGFTKVTTDPRRVGFIAGFAENGGIKATSATGNVLTIAFAADDASAASTRQAFRRHAPPAYRPHLNDVMRSQRNAVLVWTITP